MPKMICAKDSLEMSPEKNGVYVIETFQPDRKPYRVWSADLYKCKECGFLTVTGFSGQGIRPISEHFEPDFNEILTEVINSKRPLYYSHERINP